MSFRVLGTGMYVPPRVVTNDDLSQFLETNDEWITQRVGVKERHISTNETAADMGAKAARAAALPPLTADFIVVVFSQILQLLSVSTASRIFLPAVGAHVPLSTIANVLFETLRRFISEI